MHDSHQILDNLMTLDAKSLDKLQLPLVFAVMCERNSKKGPSKTTNESDRAQKPLDLRRFNSGQDSLLRHLAIFENWETAALRRSLSSRIRRCSVQAVER
jgi:hypothetical protein